MSRVFVIRDMRGERRVGDDALPLQIGGAGAAVTLPDLPVGTLVATLALAEGHAYVQPLSDETPAIYHNHSHLRDSAWLKSGDEIQIGNACLRWTVKGDHVFIDATARPTPVEPVPPTPRPVRRAQPLPTAAGEATSAPLPARLQGGRTLRRLVAAAFALLVLTAIFVLVASPVAISVRPVPDAQSLRGYPPPMAAWGQYLALPGRYTLHATRAGYRPLDATIDVALGERTELTFELDELPGLLLMQLEPAVPYRLLVDGTEAEAGSDGRWEVERGERRLRIETERHLPEERTLTVEGRGAEQVVALALRPAWADVWLATEPAGADVLVDGASLGATPLHAELMQGQPTIVFSHAGHLPVTLRPEITAGVELRLEDVVLPRASGTLTVRSQPKAATVAVDGTFRGTTPATVALAPDQAHRVELSKPGFATARQEVTLAPEEARTLSIALAPTQDAGTEDPPADERTAETLPPPPPDEPRGLTVAAPSINTAAGQVLRLVRPGGPFTMGASRREPGRRANESARLVQLTRPLYVAEKEITNAEFRRFMPAHSSGSGLDGETQPVVNVDWDDAARYCNWLSTRDRLPAAYDERDGHMTPVRPTNTGYRLPTEAEWAYVARVHGRATPARYPFPGSFPPTSPVGNFADERIADTLADVVPGYDDGYRTTAPVGSFAANPAGLFDVGGNVAEWTNDFYAVYPGQADTLARDPTGPPTGSHRVVRDSSWRQGSITEVRASYRDYSRAPRQDLGFRIVRSAG